MNTQTEKQDRTWGEYFQSNLPTLSESTRSALKYTAVAGASAALTTALILGGINKEYDLMPTNAAEASELCWGEQLPYSEIKKITMQNKSTLWNNAFLNKP